MPVSETERGLVDRYSAPVPRYTSYPTAPHFHCDVGQDTYAGWLRDSPADATVSLYLHIPFCDRLCWFCACHTKQVLRYDPIASYLEALLAEIETMSPLIGTRRVSAIHLGGGSPTMLAPADVDRLGEALRGAFVFDPAYEISLEVDPNDLDEDKLDAWVRFGVTRASFGVQDFNENVQSAINRIQTFADTSAAVDGFRRRNVGSVNLDVLYGLPHQTLETLSRTLDQVISLSPDRIALFGYAHVPWMKKHQRLIDEAYLPDRYQRFEQSRLGAERLRAAGYIQIGLDHFARLGDSLARAALQGKLRRNFQGYTTDNAEILVGLGASAIGRTPHGYVQNVTATADYRRATLGGRLPVVRGYALTKMDRATAWLIEELMCNFGFSVQELRRRFPGETGTLMARALAVASNDPDHFVRWDGTNFCVRSAGRPFIRSIASRFDRFLQPDVQRHSIAV